MVKVIKRDCTEVDFNPTKIYDAIMKAMRKGSGIVKVDVAAKIASEIEGETEKLDSISIYDIEKMVFEKLCEKGELLTARAYEGYRKVKEYQRDIRNSTDESILNIIAREDDYWMKENSNKNATLVTTQRDYIAGATSKDIADRILLPADIVQGDKEGIIHFHDKDYFLQLALHNCCLINLEDMLQNGTVISDVLIEKPHSFATACNIATQIIAQVASSQYGLN